jgi:magnesium transporter
MENENNVINEIEDRSYREQILAIIRSDISDEEIKQALDEYHDNDIASVIEELTEEENDRLLHALGSEAMSEVVPYLDDAGEYLSELEADEAADIIEQMDADEALEVLEDLDEDTRNEVLELIEDEVKEEIELIDSYEDDEFGSKMSTNFIAITRDATVKSAMRSLIAEAPENDNIYTIFVTEQDGSFYGAIDLKDLIIARSKTPLDELIYTTFPYVYDKESISASIERLRSYSEDMIPVLSSEGNKLLGVITSKDIIEIVDEERGDDYAKLAALTEEEDSSEPIFKSMKKRIPWLIALLFMGLAVSAVVGIFEGVVKELPLIVCFQSLILGMAGNVGTQSLAVTVRAISADEVTKGKQLGFIFKETRVALFNGFAIGLCSVLVVGAYLYFIGGYGPTMSFTTAGCVGLALCFAMMISGFTGATIPMCFYKLGIDPAIASGPLITTVNDLVAVISYYGLAWLLLINLAI